MARFGSLQTKTLGLSILLITFGQLTSAQSVEGGLDCTLAENANEAVCVAENDLPPGDVENFLIAYGPILGGVGLLAAVIGGGDSASSTN